MVQDFFSSVNLPDHVKRTLQECKKLHVAHDLQSLKDLAVKDDVDGLHTVAYQAGGRMITEAYVSKVKNGICVNYTEAYMRRRDPESMLIGDSFPTEKPLYKTKYGDFEHLKGETLNWMRDQELAAFVFKAGQLDVGLYGVAIAPANAGFFCLSLGILQGIVDTMELRMPITPKLIIYVAPPFRHTHFEGKQKVVHYRSSDLHEIFSYNLYPGPSAKKGVYSALIDFGERENWLIAHASVVQVLTPYGNRINIMHEGASGSGKSEMHEHIHREHDGTIGFARHCNRDEKVNLILPKGCELRPVADDMAICHPSLQKKGGHLSVYDAEAGWFIRVNHICNYGTDPDIESLSIHPQEPLIFLNIDAPPMSTALLWEHTEDKPGSPCPNPRFIVPRRIVPNVINKPVNLHVRSFGVRTPPCTKENPHYGIIGLFHVLPPALAWLWRLVSPRGFDNPSVLDSEGMSSEGVGSFWPFSTGRKIIPANLLLKQIIKSPSVHYVLCPNQHIGAWKVGFNPQWIMREYIARRGGVRFHKEELSASRCPLLGFSLNQLIIEGQKIEKGFLKVELQEDVGIEAYDQGASMLTEFFKTELSHYHKEKELSSIGKRIIDCCLSGGSVDEYDALIRTDNLYLDD